MMRYLLVAWAVLVRVETGDRGNELQSSLNLESSFFSQLWSSKQKAPEEPLRVLVLEGSQHPGKKNHKTDGGYTGLPLYWDLLNHALAPLGAEVEHLVNPSAAEVVPRVREWAQRGGDAMSVLIFTGHGVQDGGQQRLIFQTPYEEKTLRIDHADFAHPRQRMQQVDQEFSRQLGNWVADEWSIRRVNGQRHRSANRAVSQAALAGGAFNVTFARGGNPLGTVSYDEIRQAFAGTGPSLHMVDACRVTRDVERNFAGNPDEDAPGTRAAFVAANPPPPNVVTLFAVAPGQQSMNEGAGDLIRGKPKSGSGHFVGLEMEQLGLLTSSYANEIKATAEPYISFSSSYFIEEVSAAVKELCSGLDWSGLVSQLSRTEIGHWRKHARGTGCYFRGTGTPVIEGALAVLPGGARDCAGFDAPRTQDECRPEHQPEDP